MTKRRAKKIAHRFLTSIKGTYTPFGVIVDRYSDTITVVYANFPYPVRREIFKMAKQAGWDGCHWNNPTVISIHEVEVP